MKYYLYQPGLIEGPINSTRLEELKNTGKLYQFHWMIDSESQVWKSVSDAPSKNPFEATQQSLNGRTLSGGFIFSNQAYCGEIRNLNAFGIDLVIPHCHIMIRGINHSRSFMLNLCDETNQLFLNVKAKIKSQVQTEDGLLLKFVLESHGVTL